MKTQERDTPLTLPHSLEAEQAVLGMILREPSLIHTVIGKSGLTASHFFLDPHRRIYQAMVELDARSQPIEALSVMETVQHDRSRSGASPVSGSYLVDLLVGGPLTQNIDFYADVVKKKAYLRRIITACQSTAHRAYSSNDDIFSFIEEVEKEFLTIAREQDKGSGLVSARDALVPTLDALERRILADGDVTGVPSGFMDLDRYTGGWQSSDLVILAARPGMGKTALALNWAMNALKGASEITVGIFTLEMSKEQLVERLLSAEGRIDSVKLRKGDLSDEDQDRLMHAAREISKLGKRLVIDETPGISLMELRSRCRRYKREHGLDLVIIDYLQLMSGSSVAAKQSREREISEISMGLKAMAKELALPVVSLAQLNRGPDSRPDKRPKISDLRESGSMEQDADQILFVYRDEYYNPNSEHAGKAEILVAKNRHGETGSLHLAWLPSYVSFHNLLREG